MTTKLSSLRVTSEMDSTGFVAGANAVVEANKRLIETDKARGASLAVADTMLQKLPPSLASLSKALVTGYTEAAKFNADLKRIANSFDQSNGAVTRYADLYESLVLKYNMVAGASQLMAQNHKALIPVIEQVNAKLFAQIDIAERAAHAQRTASGAKAYQTDINSRLGVRTDFGSDARSADVAAYGAEMDRIAAKYDAVEAAAQSYRAKVEDLDRALKVGAISQAAFATQMNNAGEAYERAAMKAGGAVDQTDINRFAGVNLGASSAQSSGQAIAQAMAQEEQAIARVTAELERRNRVAAEGAAILQDAQLRRVDQGPLNRLLGVSDAPDKGSAASASAAVFRAELEAVERVNKELERRKTLAAEADQIYRDSVLRQVDQGPLNKTLGVAEAPKPGSIASGSAEVFRQELEAVDRVNKELERRNRLAAEGDEIFRQSQLRNIDQSSLNGLLGVRDESSAPSAQASAQAFIADEQAIARVTAELDRRNAATQAAVREEQLLRAALDPSIAAMDRYTQGLQRAQAAFSKHGDIALYRQQVAALQQELQNAGTKNLSATGVDPNVLTGRQQSGLSQSDFEFLSPEAARRTEQMEQAAKLLRLEIDPLGEAMKRLTEEQARLNAMQHAGVINDQEAAAGMQLAQQRYNRSAELIRHVGTGLRLSRHEMANLSYQFNDIAVMLASGQAPFMLFMQQGMQIAQAFTGLGLGEALKEIGAGLVSFISNPLNLAVAGFAAATAAAVYFYSTIISGGKPIKDLMEKQNELLERMKGSYESLGRVVAEMMPDSVRVVEFEVRMNLDESRDRIQSDLEKLSLSLKPPPAYIRSEMGAFGSSNKTEYLPVRKVVDDLLVSLREGDGDIQKFREEIVKLAAQDPGDEKLQKAAKSVLQLSNELEQFQRKNNQLSLSLDPLAAKLSALYSAPRKFLGEERLPDNLYGQLSDTRSPRDKLEETMNTLRKTLGGSTKELAEAELVAAQVREQLNTETEKSVRLSELDLQSINAKSPADKARIAAERERISALNTAIDAEEVNIRVQNASAQAYAQATFAIAEQNRQRMRAANDNLTSARLNTSLTGATPWDAAEAQANLQSFLDLRRQAEDSGIAFDSAQYDRLKLINAELAEQNRLTAIRKMDLDIANERRGLDRTEAERRILQRLEGAGIKEGTDEFERLATALREIDTSQLNKALDKTQQLAALDLQMIYAKSPAEKARLAGERERISALNTATAAEEVNIRVQNASAQAYAQATFAIAEQNRQRMRAVNDNLASARLNTSLTGATPWDAAEAQANLQSFLDLRKQAEDNGIAFDAAQYDRLKVINAALAEQNRLTEIRKMDLDIGNERRSLYRSDSEGSILQRLESAGIKEGTDEFERLATALREIEDIEASFGYGFRRGFEDLIQNANDFAGTTQEFMSGFNQQLESVWVNVAKTGKIEWTSMIDFMIEETSRLLYQMASSSIVNMLAGSAGNATGSPGIWSGLINMMFGGSSGLYAKGGAFYGGREITAFASGGVVSSPTYFPMAGGRTGLMGEAGPEAVMPLRRGRDGRLGVASAGGGGDTIAVSLQTSIDARGATPDMKQYIERALEARDRNLRRELPGLVADARQRGKAA
jgi:lambda family phage tail tape measure protein